MPDRIRTQGESADQDAHLLARLDLQVGQLSAVDAQPPHPGGDLLGLGESAAHRQEIEDGARDSGHEGLLNGAGCRTRRAVDAAVRGGRVAPRPATTATVAAAEYCDRIARTARKGN
ncbi:hypothetical protein PSA01_47850 [Pseudonocardia saturnea]|uniref:Uncharacterized protein n=1 Tax=Pseudonocardia saturnea TaxID=33909 RepID=A0ABQ0S4A7_9PSEU|nr:hypothetical protein Pdca_52000 [Pseudonocardia autotrophica]GEC27756.1 hypothetical protein PSA01_47850 [Pseudonocardia saturnea]